MSNRKERKDRKGRTQREFRLLIIRCQSVLTEWELFKQCVAESQRRLT